MPDDELARMPITEGARRKLRIELAQWAQANGLDVPFSIPPSTSSSRAQSREGSRDTSRAPSRDSSRPSSLPGSRCGSMSASDMRRPVRWSDTNSPRSSIDDTTTGTLMSAARSLEGMSLREKSDGEASETTTTKSVAPNTATPAVDVPAATSRGGDNDTTE